jgi:TP901 family phage tail tape measure protein
VNALGRSFGSLGNAARLATRAMTIGVIGALGVAVKEAIAFDKAMRNVNSIAKLGEKQFQGLSKQILALAKVSGQAPTTLAKGMYDIVSSGFKANAAIKILRTSSIAATAGLTDTATATKAVVAVLNAYHLSANKAARVGDILFQTVNKGVLTFEELASQIGDVLPVAAQLGVPLEDIGGAMATITLHGVNAAEAATQLKQVLVSILKPSEDLQKTIKQMGFDTGEAALKTLGLEGFMRKLTVSSKGSAAAFADWFPNVRAMNGALGITGKNIATLHGNIKAMSERGALGSAFAEQGKSIAVQWQKARASLIAAAIPIGQLLFPALKAGAEKVAEFATTLEMHMPQIRAQFGELAREVQTVGSTMAQVATSQTGSSGLVGLFAGLLTARGVLGVRAAIASLGGTLAALGPAGLIAVGAITGLAFTFSYSKQQAGLLASAIRDVNQALQAAEAATTAHKQATLQLEQAKINVLTATRQVAGAERLYERALAEGGAKSEQAKNVALALRQAKLNLKRATDDLSQAEKNEKATAASVGEQRKKATAEIASLTRQAESARQKFSQYDDQVRLAGLGAIQLSEHSLELARSMKAEAVGKFIKAMEGIERAMGRTKAQVALVAAAVATLAQALGRLPSQKQIDVFIRQHGSVQPQTGSPTAIPKGKFATGGFIPGPVGAAVPILAHAGEVVLNRAQQMRLGGPAAIASMFGFSGDAGPTFATGGFIGRRGLRKAKPSPWRRSRGRAKASSGAAREALSAVEAVNQSESNLDRMYGQLAREFDISQEVFLVDGPDGSQTLDGAAVAQRLSEIDRLTEHRNQMLALIDQEKAELQRAIERLREAIAKLQAAIRAEIRAANADAAAIRRLEGKKKKTKADEKQLERLRASETSHRSQASTYDSRVQEFVGALKGAQGNLANEVPLDRRDVELDIMELGAQRREVLAIRPSTAAGAGIGGGGDGGSIADFVGGGGAIIGPDLSQALADALRTIGQLRLALGLEAVQLPIIGQFGKGTLNVPTEGLAYVHAGEQISQRGARSMDGVPGEGDHHVVDLRLGEPFDSWIEARDIRLSEQVTLRIGEESQRRRRGGRY